MLLAEDRASESAECHAYPYVGCWEIMSQNPVLRSYVRTCSDLCPPARNVFCARQFRLDSCDSLRCLQVSSWKLAREVNRAGELGVISGTAMETVLIR